MISSLNGNLLYYDANSAVIECGGIGFSCYLSANALGKLPKVGEKAFLHTYLSVKEDALDLYGFADIAEMNCFKLIISVNGVGPKIGLAILSQFHPDQLLMYIAAGDAKALTSASGVGLKLAQRIVLELKDKVGNITGGNSENIAAVGNSSLFANTKDAVSALVAMGFSQSDASLAVGRLDATLTTEELIISALKDLSRQVL